MPSDRFQSALEEISYRFAMEVVELVRTTTLEELCATSTSPAAQVPAKAPSSRAAKKGKQAQKVSAPSKAKISKTTNEKNDEKAKKKRAWPICSVDGCGKNFYAPSGDKRLCYGHHIEAGGKPSPLLAARAKKTTEKAAKKPRTARGKKAK